MKVEITARWERPAPQPARGPRELGWVALAAGTEPRRRPRARRSRRRGRDRCGSEVIRDRQSATISIARPRRIC